MRQERFGTSSLKQDISETRSTPLARRRTAGGATKKDRAEKDGSKKRSRKTKPKES
jgi:hypothetical protein